jgi:hypothetical protein
MLSLFICHFCVASLWEINNPITGFAGNGMEKNIVCLCLFESFFLDNNTFAI